MEKTIIHDSDFTGVCLDGSSLMNADIRRTRIDGVNFFNVNLKKAKIDIAQAITISESLGAICSE